MTINTQQLQQQVLDDFAFHLGYNRDTKTGGYKRDLFHICHSPFRRLNYNTMVVLYNIVANNREIHRDADNSSYDFYFEQTCRILEKHFPVLGLVALKHMTCDTPITQVYLQYAKKKRTILCHKHQIKFSSCEAGQMMKEDFEREYYSYVH